MHPPVMVPAPHTTNVPLPHLTWNPVYDDLFRDFTAEVVRKGIRAELLGDARTYTKTWHVPLGALDQSLRQRFLLFADAFAAKRLPDGAAITIKLLDHLAGAELEFLGTLRAALVFLSLGDPNAAIAAPTTQTGSPNTVDNRFLPHCDMWIPEMLFNVFNKGVPGEGLTTLLNIDRLWDIAAEAGVPEATLEELRHIIDRAGKSDEYEAFRRTLYQGPWKARLADALFQHSYTVYMMPGEGYWVDDRRWLHGRTGLDQSKQPEEDRHHRLYRLAYRAK